jgi:hypothetical protein
MAIRHTKNMFDELYRRVLVTARSSFFAARRLEFHCKLSQWTVTLASIALIIIPLGQALNFSPQINASALNVLEVFFAIIVLAFTLLIGVDSYLLKADRMQRRGLELASIYYALEPYRDNGGNQRLYEKFCMKYDEVLSKYENHLPIDYLDFKLSKREEYFPQLKNYLPALINLGIQRFFSILLYLLLLLSCLYLVSLSIRSSTTGIFP